MRRVRKMQSLPSRYQYFVSDYYLKQHVKTVFKRAAVAVFLEHTQDFFGSCKWCNQGKRLRRLQPLLIKSFRKFNRKIQAFKHVLDLTLGIWKAEEDRQFNSFNGF